MATLTPARPRLGIALGSGSARGWAHIGVLAALAEQGIEPDIVCGSSVGALVGAIYVHGRLPAFEKWVGRLTRRDVLSLVDLTVTGRGGAMRGERLMEFYRSHVGDSEIQDLPKRFAAVATDLRTGAEVWLQQGSLVTAIRASISIPGLFTPTLVDGRWLADGGLVNPVPVNVCRALGADIVIAVELSRNVATRTWRQTEVQPAVVNDRTWLARLGRLFPGSGESVEPRETDAPAAAPRFNQVLLAALDIMEDRISRSRLAGDPPDLLLSPWVERVDPLEFSGGQSTIDEGYACVQRMLPALQHLVQPEPRRPTSAE